LLGAWCAAFALLASTGCGYRVAGRADTIPDEVRTIAIPPFVNNTTEFKIEQFLAEAVTREFQTRTRFRVVNGENGADATLRATVLTFRAVPANYDPNTNRASTTNTETQLHVTLSESGSGTVLYQNPNLLHRERYEVSADPRAYLEERQAALSRSSEAMAREVVSAVLEGF
jgi:hypothetical protein